MKMLMSRFHCEKLLSAITHAVVVTFGDALLCAVTAALYGMVIGGFGPQARNELTAHGLVTMGGLGAVVGFVLGIGVAIYNEAIRRQSMSHRTGGSVQFRRSAMISATRLRNSLTTLSRRTKSDVSPAAR